MSLIKMNVPDLKLLCKKNRMAVTGTKDILINRLLGAVNTAEDKKVKSSKSVSKQTKTVNTDKAKKVKSSKSSPKQNETVNTDEAKKVKSSKSSSKPNKTVNTVEGKKAKPTKSKQKQGTKKPHVSWIMRAEWGYHPDGFHSYQEPEAKTIGVFSSREKAISNVNKVMEKITGFGEEWKEYLGEAEVLDNSKKGGEGILLRVSYPDNPTYTIFLNKAVMDELCRFSDEEFTDSDESDAEVHGLDLPGSAGLIIDANYDVIFDYHKNKYVKRNSAGVGGVTGDESGQVQVQHGGAQMSTWGMMESYSEDTDDEDFY